MKDPEHIPKMRHSYLTLLPGLLAYPLQAVYWRVAFSSTPFLATESKTVPPSYTHIMTDTHSSSTSAPLHAFIFLHCTYYRFLMYSIFHLASLLKVSTTTRHIPLSQIVLSVLFTVVSGAPRTVPAIYQLINKNLSQWWINIQMHICTRYLWDVAFHTYIM